MRIVLSRPIPRPRRAPLRITPPMPVESDVVKLRFNERNKSLGLLPVTLFFLRAQAIARRVRGPNTPSIAPGSQSS